MPLVPGTKLGPYEVQSAIGAGGMGEVYRARDTRLDRSVAINVRSCRLGDSGCSFHQPTILISILPDGKHILAARPTGDNATEPISFTLNWQQDLC